MRRASRRSVGFRFTGDARSLHRADAVLARRHRRRPARCRRRGGRARAVDAGSDRSARHQAAACRQARLSLALPPARQCRLEPADPRCRQRLLPGADGAGHPRHHRRRIRRPRRAADAGAVRPACCRKRANCFRSARPSSRQPWMGSRPCFADSRPVISRAPNQRGLWLAYGHGHWGLSLGPATGRLIAEMMTGATPFCDPAPYAADRFLR